MNRYSTFFLCTIGACMMSTAFAWEPGTHSNLTKQAIAQSVLAVCPAIETGCTTVLQDIGLQPYGATSQKFPDPQAGEAIFLGPPGSVAYEKRGRYPFPLGWTDGNNVSTTTSMTSPAYRA